MGNLIYRQLSLTNLPMRIDKPKGILALSSNAIAIFLQAIL